MGVYSKMQGLFTARTNQADKPIPESVCEVCGGTNPVWFAPNPLWNRVMRYPDGREASEMHNFVCPNCFISEAEELGVAPRVWELREARP